MKRWWGFFHFRDRPISQKLVIVTMVTVAVALVLSAVGIVWVDSVLFREYLQRDLTTLAQIVADDSTAALDFEDPNAARQTLEALRARPRVIGACTYRMNGAVFAQYSSEPSFSCPAAQTSRSARFGQSAFTISQPIELRGKQIGTLMLVYSLGEIPERMRLYGSTVLGVFLAASLLAFVLSSRLRTAVTEPVTQLVDATTSVSETGDYGIRAHKVSGDELGYLVDRFNEMLAGIQSRDNKLKEALAEREAALRDVAKEQERFRFMAESMPQKIFAAGPGGESIYLNQQWMEYTGLPFEELQNWGWVQFIHPDDLEESLRLWKAATDSGEPLQVTNRFRRYDGVYRWHLNRGRAMRNEKGDIILWIGSCTDIHEQKEREDELRRANEDLQQFAYSASHDLQEPIRNVAVYSDIIARRYPHALDDNGRLYLSFLKESGIRLATLVNDLLAYARASRAELHESVLDASVALNNALAGLSEAVRESHASVTFDSLPHVRMGEAHLRQIFQNLIGNALKYRDETAPRVHISATTRGGFWCFSVQDNGIGIDPEYKEKIFGVFKRLHHDQKYSGTGIGLAICQRVVERYGGRIWVESEPGKGATFYFTIPQHAESAQASAV